MNIHGSPYLNIGGYNDVCSSSIKDSDKLLMQNNCEPEPDPATAESPLDD